MPRVFRAKSGIGLCARIIKLIAIRIPVTSGSENRNQSIKSRFVPPDVALIGISKCIIIRVNFGELLLRWLPATVTNIVICHVSQGPATPARKPWFRSGFFSNPEKIDFVAGNEIRSRFHRISEMKGWGGGGGERGDISESSRKLF